MRYWYGSMMSYRNGRFSGHAEISSFSPCSTIRTSMIAVPDTTRRVGLNSIWLLLGRILAQGFAALGVIIIARTLGPEGLGTYSFITSAIFLLNAFTTFGT